jgi:hypothetical protein
MRLFKRTQVLQSGGAVLAGTTLCGQMGEAQATEVVLGIIHSAAKHHTAER